jgi:hypothetical protein
MKHFVSAVALLGSCSLIVGLATAQEAPTSSESSLPSFTEPVRLEAAGKRIRVESPGYAAPCLHDVNGDGRKDLVVGQFSGGKMQIFLRGEEGRFAQGQWLEVDGEVAEVPGVW